MYIAGIYNFFTILKHRYKVICQHNCVSYQRDVYMYMYTYTDIFYKEGRVSRFNRCILISQCVNKLFFLIDTIQKNRMSSARVLLFEHSTNCIQYMSPSLYMQHAMYTLQNTLYTSDLISILYTLYKFIVSSGLKKLNAINK